MVEQRLQGITPGGDGDELLIQCLQHGGHGEQGVGLVAHDEDLGCGLRQRGRVLNGFELALQQIAARLRTCPLLPCLLEFVA